MARQWWSTPKPEYVIPPTTTREHLVRIICWLVVSSVTPVTVTFYLQVVTCSDDSSLKEMVELAVQRLYDALSPTCHVPNKDSDS